MSQQDVLGNGALVRVARPLKDFMGKLAGKEGEMWHAAFKRFLRKENPWEQPVPSSSPDVAPAIAPTSFPIWKTIRIGGMSKDALIAELEAKGFTIGGWARDMMNQPAFTTADDSVEVPLVRVTVAELGFKTNTRWKDICDRAEFLGLKRCRPEVGPHLRLADADQPLNEWYWIGMDPIVDSGRYPHVFKLEPSADGRWLRSNYALSGYRWNPQDRLVFEAASK